MSATDFNGNTVTTAYNKLNKETEVVTPMEENVTAKVKYFYDAAGNVTKQYQQNNKPGEAERFKLVETVYNSMNQPIFVISNDGNIDNIVKYEYDGIGNITKMATGITNINDAIDPSVHGVTTYTYNYLNQLVSTTDPQGNSVTNTYDKLGNVTNVTDKSGGTASYTYNGLGQILSVTANRDGKTEDISYQYDWMGNIKQVSDSSGTTNYTYDGLGQLLKETKGGVVKDYTYDANGNRKSFKLTNSGTIELNTTYAYDKQNRLISVTNDGETTSYSYDNNGNLLTATGAVSTQYTYNDANMLTAQTNRLGENVLGQYSVSYYLDGNKESIAESGKPTTSYLYDDMGRLTQEVIAGESQTNYQYDSFLNRSRKVEKDAEGNIIKTNTYQYNKNNWLLEDRETAGESQGNEVIRNFFYDNMGNQTMKTITTIGEAAGSQSVTIGEDPNGIQLFEYDPLNRMTKATINNVTTTYTYDANGLRQSKTTNGVTTSHIYDGQNIVMDSKSGEKQIFHRGISLISRTVNGGSKEYYTFNTHGDTTALVNASGTILKDYTYDAFGNQKQEQSEDNNPFRYCGEYFDNETGFIYLRARYYDSDIGRFTTEDPIKDGVNWFIYCANNPMNFIDPSGMELEGDKEKYGENSKVYIALVILGKAWNSFPELRSDIEELANEIRWIGNQWGAANIDKQIGIYLKTGVMKGINTVEQVLSAAYRSDAAKINSARKTADKETFAQFNQEGNGTDGANAFKHGLWSALSTKAVGEKKARLFLNAHEFGWVEENLNDPDAMMMDIHNNWRGRELAKVNSKDKLAKAVANDLARGNMKVIKNGKLVYSTPEWRAS